MNVYYNTDCSLVLANYSKVAMATFKVVINVKLLHPHL